MSGAAPYQNTVKLLSKRNLHCCELGLLIQLRYNSLILPWELPNRLSEECFRQWGFDLFVWLGLRGALQQVVNERLVDFDRLQLHGSHVARLKGSRGRFETTITKGEEQTIDEARKVAGCGSAERKCQALFCREKKLPQLHLMVVPPCADSLHVFHHLHPYLQ